MKYMNKISLILVLCLSSFTLLAQTKVKGKVTDGKEPVIGANVSVKGTTEGTVTDIDGNFELTTSQATPFKLVVTMVGMATSEMEISGSQNDLTIKLSEETSILNDVVVSASRVEEKILESPVTIEKMDQKSIKAAASTDYYDDLAKLKGVQTINGSMTFTAVNTRGFGGISNTRFVQLMDGMDNAAPLLNFPTGNVVGIGELDINNVELVPGAASALYGPNAFNGILLMNSKNPFEQPGFSMQVKGGFAQASNGYGIKPTYTAAMRFGHAFKCKKTGQDYLAIKANFSIFQGTDWFANDYTTTRNNAAALGTPGFDGLNLYGDETNIFEASPTALPGLFGAMVGNGIAAVSPGVKQQVTAGYQAVIRAQVTAQVKAQVKAGIKAALISGGMDEPTAEATAEAQASAAILAPPYSTTITNTTAAILASKGQEIDSVTYVNASAYVNSKVDSIKPLIASSQLRRTGLKEERLLDNNKAQSIKGDFGVYLRPFKDKSYEFSYTYRIGFGNSVYQGSERYALRNFTQQFHKLEIKGKDFFIRSYMSQTHDGNSYNNTALGAYVNETVTPTSSWVPSFYAGLLPQLLPAILSPTNSVANILSNPQLYYTMADSARAKADRPWSTLSPEEQQAVIEKVRTGLFQRGGAGFIDNSRLFHTEAMIDLSRWSGKWIDIQVGGNYRRYSLSTQGTVFNEDPDGTGVYKRININEYGAFLQLQRKLFKERLKIQASIRWDLNQNFKSVFSPRVALVGTLGKDRNHNIRVSYQTGFRNPDSQAQYIYFPTTSILLGGTKANAERYGIYNGGAWTQASYTAFVASNRTDSSLLQTVNISYVKPEQLQVVELGYKAVLFKKLLIDINGYFNIYKDFIGQISVVNKDTTYHKGNVITPGNSWRPYTNLADAYSYGAGIGVGYMLPKNLMVRASYNFMDFKLKSSKDPAVTVKYLGFNASKHQLYVGISGDRVWKGLGFALDYRWQSAIAWSSDFADGTVKARGMLDASLSYFVEKAFTTFKVGATNIAGPEYRTNVGGPFIGRTFFVGITFDQGKMWKEHHAEVTGAKEF
ncbi:MAG: carboxypeptidase-like regulatory domain-containing protein [Chitinophagales bacterium]